jgi:hypothetical protein
MSTYVHPTPNYLRDEIDRLAFAPPAPAEALAEVQQALTGPLVTRLLPETVGGSSGGATSAGDPQAFPALPAERDIGFEPTTFSLGS